MTQAQYLERQHKSDLLPGVKDCLSAEEASYWSERNFIYYACVGYKNPHLIQQFWEEMDYYEVFEIFVHNTIHRHNSC